MPIPTLKEGDRGPAVTSLQKLLVRNGTNWRFYYGAIDGHFGPNTGQAVRRAKYRLGYLKASCNEQAGRRLRELLREPDRRGQAYKTRAGIRYERDKAAVEKTTDIAGKAWKHIVHRIGHHESPPGSNLCPETKEWGHGPMPWCAVTVSLCYIAAGSEAFSKAGQRYQYVPAIVQAARAGTDGLKLVSTPAHGDLVIWRTASGTYGHVSMFGGWADARHAFMVEIGGNEGLQGVVKRDVSSPAYASAYVRVTS